jgi:branched-chain amino acid transport system permease protein
LCGVAGTLLVPIYYVFPTIGAYFVLIAFVVVVLGGLGNVFGAFFGGLLIGITEVLSGYFFTSSFKEGIYFLIFILVLLIRPSGIFGLGKT